MNKTFENLIIGSIEKQFIHHFTCEIQSGKYHLENEIIGHVHVAAQKLFDLNYSSCPDTQARIILKLCCLSLSSYHALLAEINNSQVAYSIVKNTIGKLYQRFARFAFRPLLWLVNDPVKVISIINWKKLSQIIYGKAMDFEQEVLPDRAILIVNRCAFHKFFVDQGEPHLTQVFCAWDRLWMDVIDNSRRPIRTERPTTISTGSACCQFQCIRETGKIGKKTNDVILEQ
jgi:L-2-amino-thiazoline-4-carboxylic acid hydrolase